MDNLKVLHNLENNYYDDLDTKIKIFGIGGAGCNALNHMIQSQVQGVEFIAANTDVQALNFCLAQQRLVLGETGLGAGSKPEKGRLATEAQAKQIKSLLENTNMVFITAGMGGGTGTGGAPVIARIAKQMGILTVAVVSKPFKFEGSRRNKIANESIEKLRENVDALIVVLNDKLIDVLGDDATACDCFKAANDVLKNAVSGIVEIICKPGLINVDFEDVCTVMTNMGKSMMGTGIASGEDRAKIAAKQAIESPLLDGVNLATAKGILINISGSKNSLKMKECADIMEIVQSISENKDDDYIVMGAVYDESLEDNIKVTIVATGLNTKISQPKVIITNPNLKTGTDNSNIMDHPMLNQYQLNAEQLKNSGIENLTIPAFLRKQMD